ncbi:hypothetical protein R3P38DRAFT_3197225 [Favolaschia claudopus]|uniref:NACHT domain-containing protein n=1 Tax=Favolaschia claudopus TaxID=2862362 RepID=A0AAW0B3X8_9AGAR
MRPWQIGTGFCLRNRRVQPLGKLRRSDDVIKSIKPAVSAGNRTVPIPRTLPGFTPSTVIHDTGGITNIPGIHRTAKLYVTVDLDGSRVLKTPDIEGTLSPQWNFDGNIMSSSQSATLTLQVHHHSRLGLNRLIGECDTTIEELLHQSGQDTLIALDIRRDAVVSGQIFLRLSQVPSQDLLQSADHAMEEMPANIKRLTPMPRSNLINVATTFAESGGFPDLLGKLLSQIKPVADMGDEIHPYLNVAWKVLTSVYKAVEKQRNTDEKITKLVQALVDLYTSVGDMDFLRIRIQTLERVVLEVAAQTVECSLFIRRLLRMPFSDTEKKINELSEVLTNLKDSFDRGTAIQSVFISAEIRDKVCGLIESDLLQRLTPAQYNAALREECLQGTRKDIITKIADWLSSPPNASASNIFWLHGVAGSGKSTIANTVAQYFQNLHRLGAFIFFDRDTFSSCDIRGVLHHIANRLAESNVRVRKALCDALSADAMLVDANYRTQFHKLVLDPLTAAAPYIYGPIVIIVDGLDECADLVSRKALLSLIAGDMARLPAAFRLLVTSRPDLEITRELQLKPHILPHLLVIGTEDTKEDIICYLRQCLRSLCQDSQAQGPQWPREEDIQLLATHSGGLFIWAATAFKFLQGFNPRNRLSQLLRAGNTISSDLDQLYRIALENAGDWRNADFSLPAVSVLACVVLSRKPLTSEAIEAFLPESAAILESLACVLECSPGVPIRTLHASFSDYLTDPDRTGCAPWFIDTDSQNQFLATRCLQVLNSKLRFNICSFETSHCRNSDVPDLAERIGKHVSNDLTYAAQFWAHHLRAASSSPEVLHELEIFSKRNLLYWLEVLSLLGYSGTAHEAVKVAEDYVQGKHPHLAAFLHDGSRFIETFAHAFAQSMPHLYVSALAIAPKESVIRQHYGQNCHSIMQCASPIADNWSSLLKTLPARSGAITSVAVSSDGTTIASGSNDCTVLIWNSRTGAAVAEPLKGHSNSVTSVAFSPDSARVVSGSSDCTIRVWDARTGAVVVGPFDGHRKSVTSVDFSPCGSLVVSGSDDCTVRLWNSQTGATVQPFKGHSDCVTSVAFSPDGTRIVSGSNDCTLRIWNSQTGLAVAGPFKGHSDSITSVAFSPVRDVQSAQNIGLTDQNEAQRPSLVPPRANILFCSVR